MCAANFCKKRRIAFLLAYFFHTAVNAAPISNQPKEITESGRFQAKVINKELPVQYLYKFAFEVETVGSNVEKKHSRELYYQETNCKKEEMKDVNQTMTCNFKHNGSIIICKFKASIIDITGCRFTGEKYEIPLDDRRSEVYAMEAVKAYNQKNYPPDSNLKLSLDVSLTSPLLRKVEIGTKNEVSFSTKEFNCTKKGTDEESCVTVKPRLDCKARIDDPMTSISEIESKAVFDVKCTENSNLDVISMKKNEPREKTACRIVHYNPTETASRSTTICFKNGKSTTSDIPLKIDHAKVEEIKILPGKASPSPISSDNFNGSKSLSTMSADITVRPKTSNVLLKPKVMEKMSKPNKVKSHAVAEDENRVTQGEENSKAKTPILNQKDNVNIKKRKKNDVEKNTASKEDNVDAGLKAKAKKKARKPSRTAKATLAVDTAQKDDSRNNKTDTKASLVAKTKHKKAKTIGKEKVLEDDKKQDSAEITDSTTGRTSNETKSKIIKKSKATRKNISENDDKQKTPEIGSFSSKIHDDSVGKMKMKKASMVAKMKTKAATAKNKNFETKDETKKKTQENEDVKLDKEKSESEDDRKSKIEQQPSNSTNAKHEKKITKAKGNKTARKKLTGRN